MFHISIPLCLFCCFAVYDCLPCFGGEFAGRSDGQPGTGQPAWFTIESSFGLTGSAVQLQFLEFLRGGSVVAEMIDSRACGREGE
jgi:hypothetical protein